MKVQLLNYAILQIIKYWVNDIQENGCSNYAFERINEGLDLLIDMWSDEMKPLKKSKISKGGNMKK